MTGGISKRSQVAAKTVVGRQQQATARSLVSTRQAEKAAQDLYDLIHSLTEIVE